MPALCAGAKIIVSPTVVQNCANISKRDIRRVAVGNPNPIHGLVVAGSVVHIDPERHSHIADGIVPHPSGQHT